MAETLLVILCVVLGFALQAHAGCKSCAAAIGKEEKGMFRAHSDACLASSKADPKLVVSLLRGELVEDPALRRHVYCVLLRCKMISKDGKLRKTALMGNMARTEANNITKVLESCSEQSGDTPEELAWNLFKCGFAKKAALFDYMTMPSSPTDADADNLN